MSTKNDVMSTKNDVMSTKNYVMSTKNYVIFRKNNVMSTKKVCYVHKKWATASDAFPFVLFCLPLKAWLPITSHTPLLTVRYVQEI